MNRLHFALALLAGSACGLLGCNTIQYCKGMEPYKAAELPSLSLKELPAPDPVLVRQAAQRVMAGTRKGARDWDEADGSVLQKVTEFEPTSRYSNVQHSIAWDGIAGHRSLYVVQQRSNGASVISGDATTRTDVYDTDTCELLASWGLLGYTILLVWVYEMSIEPVEIDGVPAMRKLMQREAEPADLRFEFSEARITLLGLFGWGRSNHKRYFQVLWIPIVAGADRP